MELTKGQYFGERALLKHEPRAANVIAVGKLKCLFISKDAFEEVLGSLQAIIEDDRKWREQLAEGKKLQQEAEGLAGIDFGSFTLSGMVANDENSAGAFVLASIKDTKYTIKAISKAKVAQMSVQSRVMNEKNLLTAIQKNFPFAPLALTFLADPNYLYIVFKTSVVTTLGELMEMGTFSEGITKFYVASVASAIRHLHGESIVYRNIHPDTLVVTSDGYVQLMDMTFAVKMSDGDKPRDFTGVAHYLSPEQVSAQGHDYAVDYWAMGILMYEMLLGKNPWLTGDDTKDTELSIYAKISAHKSDGITGTGTGEVCQDFLNGLLDPAVDRRLGTRGVGAEEIQVSKWMTGFSWSDLTSKAMEAPHRDNTSTVKTAAAKLDDRFSGDDSWCKDYSSFVTAA